MRDTSLSAVPPSGQADLVPDEWIFIGDWRTDDGVNVELYVDPGSNVGRLIAIPPHGKAVRAASIADADRFFTLGWTGEIDRPAAWRNAQRAIALGRYERYRR